MRPSCFNRLVRIAEALALTAACAAALPVHAKEGYRVGVVTFLTGGAASPFGVPAKNAAELVFEALNAGSLPAPYHTKGVAGMTVHPILIDEVGGAEKQVAEYRKLVEAQKVDAVIGYISSADCLAIGPVAEELKKLTIFFDCGTPRIFEERSHKYLFRTGPSATMDNIAAARYLLEIDPGLNKVNGINQDYAWGQDSWNDFIKALQKLKPDLVVGTSQMPKLAAGQYSTEIAALMASDAKFVHSSFWGVDMEALLLQGGARGLFAKQVPVFTAGETALFRLTGQIPEGAVIGGRGPYGIFAPDNALNRWFREAYTQRYKTPPTYPSYKMAQAILGLKAAADKAAARKKGAPSERDIIAALEGLEYEAPSGKVRMKRANGHQAIQEMVYGRYKREGGKPGMTGVKRYPAECVIPPEGMTASEWIEKGFPGAKCR